MLRCESMAWIATGFAAAPVRFDQTYRTPRYNHCAIEPHALTVAWEGKGNGKGNGKGQGDALIVRRQSNARGDIL